jgi:hypothetical protein
MAYLNVVPPPVQPAPSVLCKLLTVGCPVPVTVNPDNLAGLYAPLAAWVQTYAPFQTGGVAALSGYRGMGCAGECQCGGKCHHGLSGYIAAVRKAK